MKNMAKVSHLIIAISIALLFMANTAVHAQSMISVSPSVLSNSTEPGTDASDQSFEVWNSGAGTITYNVADDAQWLSITPVSGSSTGESDTITVEYLASSLAAGLYNATITITDPNAANSPVQIPVTLTVSDKSPIYRFWSANNSSHFYTMSEAEKYTITVTYPEDVWNYETIAWFAYSAEEAPAETKPVYRFWSDNNQVHFYTISEEEKDAIIATYPEEVWRFEGIAYYAYAAGEQPEGAMPVYRFWSPNNQRHFYTISEAEKDNVIATYPEEVWTYELISWYAFDQPGDEPITFETLTVNKTGTGSGTVTGTGISCGQDCAQDFANGTQVTLTAVADSGSSFSGWTGCDSPSGNTCSVTMDQDKTVVAMFEESTVDPNDMDDDGDGYTENEGDCDDTNAGLNPETVWYLDADNDGYSEGTAQTQCMQPQGYQLAGDLTATSGDCDDTNAGANPGAAEIPGDGIDNNCNGSVDEDQTCSPEVTEWAPRGSSPSARPNIWATISSACDVAIDQSSIEMTLDGSPVTSTVSGSGSEVTASYQVTEPPLEQEADHTASVRAEDVNGGTVEKTWTFNVPDVY